MARYPCRSRCLAPLLATMLLAAPDTVGAADGVGGCIPSPIFGALLARIEPVVGSCLNDARVDEATGDTVQSTARGLLVSRTADGAIAFTDGYRTWIEGPQGPQQRLNGERFDWEAPAAGKLLVRVRLAAAAGAPAGGGPRLDSDLGAIPGLIVRVRTPGGGELASAATDAAGEARFVLVPGSLWVYAARGQSIVTAPGAPTSPANLPTGESVITWSAIDVLPDTEAAIELVVRIVRP